MRRALSLALVPVLMLAASPALAAPSPQSTTFTVSANVIRSCTVSASDLPLGTYDPMATAALEPATPSSITVNCTKNTSFTIAPLTTANAFRMANGTERLNYSLYQAAGHGRDWSTSNATGTSVNVSTPVTFNVFGAVPAGQDVPGGSYSDTVTVTVTF